LTGFFHFILLFSGTISMKNTLYSVLFEDDHLIAVDKIAGLLTIPDRYNHDEQNLRDLVSERYGDVRVVHRIDKGTSGVVVLAKTAETHQALNTLFETRDVSKTYVALCNGHPHADSWTIDRPLRLDADRLHRTVIDAYRGKEAITQVQVLEKFRSWTWVECRPETGRTHQIRVHLAENGLPLVGDELYGDGKGFFLSSIKPGYKNAEDVEEKPIVGRLALHAFSLEFTHPVTGAPFRIEAPVPKDLKAALQQLKKLAPFRAIAAW
jgi:RluA family pseudouridine synthase